MKQIAMKQIAIVSGKGGTGKTTVCASLAELAKNKVIADCDVEAPNLHLLIDSELLREKDFYGSKIAEIDREKCRECGECVTVCRFGAIRDFSVDEIKCEGCAACVFICPHQAVSITDVITGKTILSASPWGKFSHAKLNIGADGSGKLVTEVRKNALDCVTDGDIVIIDGSPGIGCVVIASITGCDAILVVSEPTLSGKHDLIRVLDLAEHFGIKAYVCINKYDLNPYMTEEISSHCTNRNVMVIGSIPFDREVGRAIIQGIPVVRVRDSAAGKAVKDIWAGLRKELFSGKEYC
ncbi:ATP-binding protein [Phosphitispora sp. TUW77]|uniref:ATP-binding protein n=1 Tax=Phosphitispora sp. TUW77 TaxID=3152361 RepID=UPI003AB2ECE0